MALALILQGLIPAAAIAHDHAAGGATELCTPQGLKPAPVRPDHHHGFGGLACEQCVMASLAMTGSAPPPVIERCKAAEIIPPPIAERPSLLPRAPPRPPSCGPPLFS
jgi:hypothetical protein